MPKPPPPLWKTWDTGATSPSTRALHTQREAAVRGVMLARGLLRGNRLTLLVQDVAIPSQFPCATTRGNRTRWPSGDHAAAGLSTPSTSYGSSASGLITTPARVSSYGKSWLVTGQPFTAPPTTLATR